MTDPIPALRRHAAHTGRTRGPGRVPGRLAALVGLCVALLVGTPVLGATPAGAAKKTPPVTVLVTNDDGVDAPGMDAVVEALRKERRTTVVVVAPLLNQSGTGGKLTAGPVTGAPARTASGYEAFAVQGFPADSVNYAFDVRKVRPNVVVSGVNRGQNLGPISEVSGTVGAARQAARRGVPALAVSSQLGDNPDFATSARLAVEWLRENRKAFAKIPKIDAKALPDIVSINVPNCPGGIRGVRQTVLAPQGTTEPLVSADPVSCSSTLATVANDAQAFNNGFASSVRVPVVPTSG